MEMEEYLDQQSDKLTLNTFVIIKRIMKYLKRHLLLFIVAMVLAFGTAIFSSLAVLTNVEIVAALGKPGFDVNYVYQLGGIFALLLCGQSLTAFISNFMVQKVANDIIYDLRKDVYAHILSLSISQLQSKPVGKWVTRATNDINSIMTFFSDVLMVTISSVLYIVFYTISIFYLQWMLALIVLGFMILIFVISILFSNASQKKNRLFRKSLSGMNSFLSENLSGMETIQEFNQEKRKYDEFTKISTELKTNDYNALKVYAIFRPLIFFLYVMTILVTFVVGFYLIQDQIIGIAVLYGFYQFIGNLFNPIQNIANQFNSIQQALTGAERVLLVLDIVPEISDEEEPIELKELKGKVEFKNVWFAYNGDNWILKDVSFVINPGETVAFVGETGAGKSTIINLIVRNYDIQKGEILIDDIPIKRIKISSLRSLIGEMLQDVVIFAGTITSNIALDGDYDPEQVKKACEFVGLDDFIQTLPKKYDEEVFQSGNNFSQGQRQLISFARVVYSKPSMVILDEATSNIDTETEVIIQNSLEKIKSIGTMVMIAHRLSTIKHASTIYVIDNGKIIEQGSHLSLLRKRGVYYNLYKIQSLKKNLE